MAKVNIQLTKQQQQYLAVGLLVLGGGGFAYVKYFWIPTAQKITETKAKIEELQGKIDKAKSQVGRLDKIKKELEVLNQKAVEAEDRLPKAKDLPGVLVTIADVARKNGCEIRTFASGASAPKQYFIELLYTVSIKGSYHDLGRFFAAAALEQRIYNVRNVAFGAADAEGKLNASFTLVSYQYKG